MNFRWLPIKGVMVVAIGALLIALLAIVSPAESPAPADAAINDGVPFNPDQLDPQPLWNAGVTNPPVDPNRDNELPAVAAVWDFAEIGNRIYVGGLFPGVKTAWNSSVQNQSYLAAFDRDTGDWISSFRPNINGGVYALDVTPNGKLLVGGNFSRVNGTNRNGLVALEPSNGAIVGSFAATTERYYDNQRTAIVRGFERRGNQLYVMGNFDHIRYNGTDHRVWSMARLDATNGQIDTNFLPKVRYGVWDAAIDEGRGRVHISGDFESIDYDTRHAKMGTVSITNGDPIGGINYHEPNDTEQDQMPAIEMSGDRVYVGGSQHVTHVKQGSDLREIGWNSWGVSCNNRIPDTCGNFFGGGDVQVIEEAAGWILTGCHCWNRSGDVNRMHYSTFTGQRTSHQFVGIYNGANSRLSSFKPLLRDRQFGTWAIHVDANGCLYLGGDYTGAANGNYVGGFGKFCAPTPAPSVSGSASGSTVSLTWSQPDSAIGVERYKIFRDGSSIGEVGGNTRSFTDNNRPNGTYSYEVRAIDTHTRRASDTVSVTVNGDGGGPAPTVGRVEVRHSGKCLDVLNASTADGVTLQQWRCHSGDNQKWEITPVGGGFHTFKVLHSNKCMEVSGYSTANGAQVVQSNCDGGGNQQFTFVDVGDGYRQIRARHSGKCIDVSGNSQADNARVQQWNCAFNSQTNQDWKFSAGGGPGDGPDTTPPSTPGNARATRVSSTSARVSWNASTDNVAVKGYLVHDNYQYQRFVSGPDVTSTTFTGLAPGSTHRYQVRAQDRSNNNSPPSTRADIAL